MDRLFVRGMLLYGRHGEAAWERRIARPFRVDLELFLDLTAAGETDDLGRTVDWAAVYQVVRREVEERSFHLVERLAQVVAEAVLARFPVEEVEVRVEKVQVPLPGPVEGAGVTLRRRR
jgi:dihydroneopterin aldolase